VWRNSTGPLLIPLVFCWCVLGCGRPCAVQLGEERCFWDPGYAAALVVVEKDRSAAEWAEGLRMHLLARLNDDMFYELLQRIRAHSRDADALVLCERAYCSDETGEVIRYFYVLLVRVGERYWCYARSPIEVAFPFLGGTPGGYLVCGEVRNRRAARDYFSFLDSAGIWEAGDEVLPHGYPVTWVWAFYCYDRNSKRTKQILCSSPIPANVFDLGVVKGEKALRDIPVPKEPEDLIRRLPSSLFDAQSAPASQPSWLERLDWAQTRGTGLGYYEQAQRYRLKVAFSGLLSVVYAESAAMRAK
jgi:hypothetical protein